MKRTVFLPVIAVSGCASTDGYEVARRDTFGYKVYDPMDCSDDRLNTSPVGSLKPNAFGVHDIIGNVIAMTQTEFASPRRSAKPQQTRNHR